MTELEPGHPDELVQTFRNWLAEAQSPEGTLLPEGIDQIEWAIRRFIDVWRRPARLAIESIEESLATAMSLCDSGAAYTEIQKEIDIARQTLQEDLRDHLGLYDWNKD
ncbi:MAG: hypothetical protein JNK90_27350 [Planctomycetaceae bacterium]|nr:hypothetical protein [Planctomycetaceae bacterium]